MTFSFIPQTYTLTLKQCHSFLQFWKKNCAVLQTNKCQLFCTKIEYLGFTISEGHIEVKSTLDFYKGKHASVENNILNSLVCTDLSGPHMEDLFGYKYVLVMIESSTRFLITEPLKSKKPTEDARSFVNR